MWENRKLEESASQAVTSRCLQGLLKKPCFIISSNDVTGRHHISLLRTPANMSSGLRRPRFCSWRRGWLCFVALPLLRVLMWKQNQHYFTTARSSAAAARQTLEPFCLVVVSVSCREHGLLSSVSSAAFYQTHNQNHTDTDEGFHSCSPPALRRLSCRLPSGKVFPAALCSAHSDSLQFGFYIFAPGSVGIRLFWFTF